MGLALFCLAPTAGDVGGCGTTPTALDPGIFAAARKTEDCQRCTACGLSTPRCLRACDPGAPPETIVPSTCAPLQHDGEVCLRALDAASCSSYATYVDPIAPATPSECDFCRNVDATAPPPPSFGNAPDAAPAEAGP
jgi:hypothetical protein